MSTSTSSVSQPATACQSDKSTASVVLKKRKEPIAEEVKTSKEEVFKRTKVDEDESGSESDSDTEVSEKTLKQMEKKINKSVFAPTKLLARYFAVAEKQELEEPCESEEKEYGELPDEQHAMLIFRWFIKECSVYVKTQNRDDVATETYMDATFNDKRKINKYAIQQYISNDFRSAFHPRNVHGRLHDIEARRHRSVDSVSGPKSGDTAVRRKPADSVDRRPLIDVILGDTMTTAFEIQDHLTGNVFLFTKNFLALYRNVLSLVMQLKKPMKENEFHGFTRGLCEITEATERLRAPDAEEDVPRVLQDVLRHMEKAENEFKVLEDANRTKLFADLRQELKDTLDHPKEKECASFYECIGEDKCGNTLFQVICDAFNSIHDAREAIEEADVEHMECDRRGDVRYHQLCLVEDFINSFGTKRD